jgi:spore coat polysaccharide biosynthesis protein SpsF (cytidylyltransferase family)
MKIVCSIAARMRSSRFPGKVLAEVAGKPLLGYLLDRVELCRNLDQTIVSTTEATEDSAIEDYCQSRNIFCYRGDEHDVLGRLLKSYKAVDAEIGVVVFGDGPLIDPTIVDRAIDLYLSTPDYDFVGNDLKTTYPPGMEVEVFSIRALFESAERCESLTMREHGTLYLRTHPDDFRIYNFEAEESLRRVELALEVDTIEDFRVIEKILEHFGERVNFSLQEIIEFLDSAGDLVEINKHIPRRWHQYRSN